MQIVIHATDIIDGKTYISDNFTVDAGDCRTPEGAKTVMTKFLAQANDTFDRIREKQKRKSSYG
jgi:hypothetical protein